nr:AMP-binding protein [Micromonospora provocatoris]
MTALSIRDAGGRPATEGELFVRTPAQAGAYWNDPVETAEVFVDGWVRTRDLARLDGDGYLYLLGRIRDVVIVQANLVYAGPIERVLAADPTVAEAYVVGRPDDVTGGGGARVRGAGRRLRAGRRAAACGGGGGAGRGVGPADDPADRAGAGGAQREAGQARPDAHDDRLTMALGAARGSTTKS